MEESSVDELKMDTPQEGAEPVRWSLKAPTEMVELLRSAFDKEGIKYELDEDAIRSAAGPDISVFDFDHGTDVAQLRRIVDEAA